MICIVVYVLFVLLARYGAACAADGHRFFMFGGRSSAGLARLFDDLW